MQCEDFQVGASLKAYQSGTCSTAGRVQRRYAWLAQGKGVTDTGERQIVMMHSTSDMFKIAATHRLDLRGETCPTTSDQTLRTLEEMLPGEVLEVVSDYYPARWTIPFHCDKRGYRYAFGDASPDETSAHNREVWRIRIQKS